MSKWKVPEVTVERLAIYLRALRSLSDGMMLSSQRLADLVGTSDVQVRKDLAYFGEFGIPGQGYSVATLKQELTQILALDRQWHIVLAGVGRLGMALLAYPGLKRSRFSIVAVFDNDPMKVSTTVQGLTIQSSDILEAYLEHEHVRIGIITTPAAAAQDIADRMIAGGITGILNFAPTRITVPEPIKLKNVDLSMELETLSYFLSKKNEDGVS
jgi:redox-sensing transcriptional repressor